jgi:hypothetical protein
LPFLPAGAAPELKGERERETMINFLVKQLHLKMKHTFLSHFEEGGIVSFSKENIEETFEAIWNSVILESGNPDDDLPEIIIESCKKEGIPELFWPLICAAGLARFSLIKNKQGNIELAVGCLCLAEFSAGIFVAILGFGAIPTASLLAKKRHAKWRNESEKVIRYWSENILPLHPSLSASKSAEQIKMVGISSLGYRKIAELIAAEKKKQS